jgi:hypothetical protein
MNVWGAWWGACGWIGLAAAAANYGHSEDREQARWLAAPQKCPCSDGCQCPHRWTL